MRTESGVRARSDNPRSRGPAPDSSRAQLPPLSTRRPRPARQAKHFMLPGGPWSMPTRPTCPARAPLCERRPFDAAARERPARPPPTTPARTDARQPAVLDRPHQVLVQPTRPTDRGQMPRVVGLDFPAAAHSAGTLIDRRPPARRSCQRQNSGFVNGEVSASLSRARSCGLRLATSRASVFPWHRPASLSRRESGAVCSGRACARSQSRSLIAPR